MVARVSFRAEKRFRLRAAVQGSLLATAARLAVLVDRCRKRPDGRLASVSGLALVRRAARAHGGEVRVRAIPGDGCALTLDLPLTPES